MNVRRCLRILGLDHKSDHTWADIQAAHRKCMIASHPDRPNGNVDKFARVQAAFETLSSVAQTNSLFALMQNHENESDSSDDEELASTPDVVQKVVLPNFARGHLKGCSFVLTGVFEADDAGHDIGRQKLCDWIRRYGGRVVLTVSNRVVAVLVAKEPHERTIEAAKRRAVPVIGLKTFCELLMSNTPFARMNEFSFE